MRFGRKLALQLSDDQSDAPYISHKLLKQKINDTVRLLKVGGLEAEGNVRSVTPESAQGAMVLDAQFFEIVDFDLAQMKEHMRATEKLMEHKTAVLQDRAIKLGILFEDSWIKQFEQTIPWVNDPEKLSCMALMVRIMNSPSEFADGLLEFCKLYNGFIEHSVDTYMQYIEINVAGFRKLLKQHDKRIPKSFHSRATPFLGFHSLVTRRSRHLLASAQTLGDVCRDAQLRLQSVISEQEKGADAICSDAICVPIAEPKPLGAECEMVLQIQQQLKAASESAKGRKERESPHSRRSVETPGSSSAAWCPNVASSSVPVSAPQSDVRLPGRMGFGGTSTGAPGVWR